MWIFGHDAIWGYEELFYTAFGSLRGIGEIFRAMGPSCLDRSWFRSCQSSRFLQRRTSWSRHLAGWILSGWFAVKSRYATSRFDSIDSDHYVDRWWNRWCDSRYPSEPISVRQRLS